MPTAYREPMSHSASEPAVEISRLRYAWKQHLAPVLEIEQLSIATGERVFIQGPSGSGKTTLLNLIAGVTVAQSGNLRVLGTDPASLAGARRDRLRADHIGFIFQLFNLIPYLSVVENVCLPCSFSARRRVRAEDSGRSIQEEARRLLTRLDMGDASLLSRPVTDLSVGQQQRVAAARALMGAPEIVIADEPTSSLDSERRAVFVDLLFQECERVDATLIFVSHDAALISRFDRVIRFAEINRAQSTQASAA